MALKKIIITIIMNTFYKRSIIFHNTYNPSFVQFINKMGKPKNIKELKIFNLHTHEKILIFFWFLNFNLVAEIYFLFTFRINSIKLIPNVNKNYISANKKKIIFYFLVDHFIFIIVMLYVICIFIYIYGLIILQNTFDLWLIQWNHLCFGKSQSS